MSQFRHRRTAPHSRHCRRGAVVPANNRGAGYVPALDGCGAGGDTLSGGVALLPHHTPAYGTIRQAGERGSAGQVPQCGGEFPRLCRCGDKQRLSAYAVGL